MKNKLSFLFGFLFIFSLLAFSENKPNQNNNNQPIYIEANKMDYNNNIVDYEGNVIATRGNGKLTCQHLFIYLDKNNKIQKIIATGNPVYTEPNRLIKGDNIEYDVPQDVVIVTGRAFLQNKQDVVQGNKVIYYRKLNKAVVTGKRVQSVFVPTSQKGGKK